MLRDEVTVLLVGLEGPMGDELAGEEGFQV